MSTYHAVVVEDETDVRVNLLVEAPTFGAALHTVTTDHVPDGWRIESVKAVLARAS